MNISPASFLMVLRPIRVSQTDCCARVIVVGEFLYDAVNGYMTLAGVLEVERENTNNVCSLQKKGKEKWKRVNQIFPGCDCCAVFTGNCNFSQTFHCIVIISEQMFNEEKWQ